ncbi:PepSY domain-containing protein [Tabrizicola sp.]|uniref:PepSY domain-containing protein n=1 Tax=Tabrizicola sp. TaxID=2005166 RepID=UPI002FDF07DD
MKLMMMAAGFSIWGGMALAAVDTDALVADLQRQGYSWIEVKRGPTQIEVEAVRGTNKIETVYDIATGAVLDHETDRASRREQSRTGVKVRDSLRDFEDRDDDDHWDDDDRRDDDRDDRHDRDDDRDDHDHDRDDHDHDRDDHDHDRGDRGGRDRDRDDD